jgi:hypothetical protein
VAPFQNTHTHRGLINEKPIDSQLQKPAQFPLKISRRPGKPLFPGVGCALELDREKCILLAECVGMNQQPGSMGIGHQ